MKRILSRRAMLVGGTAALGGVIAATRSEALFPTRIPWLQAGDALSYAAHRTLLPRHSLVREFSRDRITPLPAIGTTNPEDENYKRLLAGNFADWRLPVVGLVSRTAPLSLDELKRLPSRTQVTQQSCEEGWTGIAEWTGVPLGRVLEACGIADTARFVVFNSVDGWWDSIDMDDALHPQTMLAYGMNGQDLPVPHGAPVRLRVERQLGYKSMKYLTQIMVVERLADVEDGTGSGAVKHGYSWYAGI
jgi:DMSO/TMAO reductase YedYZ molybdopterin-dependent catalytic subunit